MYVVTAADLLTARCQRPFTTFGRTNLHRVKEVAVGRCTVAVESVSTLNGYEHRRGACVMFLSI